MPRRASRSRVALVCALPGVRCSTSCAWCSAARLSQSVVALEVATAPAMMRRKLFSPEPAAIWSCRRPPSARLTSGMKKHDTAAPWMMVGTTSVQRSISVLKRERIHATTAKMRSEAVA